MATPWGADGPLALSPSRLVGLGLLLAMLAVHWVQAPSTNVLWRDGWWDLMQTLMPRDRGDPAKAPAVVIAIDEDTMSETQRWPWPRDLLAKLIEKIASHGATVVAFDIFLDGTDSQSPTAFARRFRDRGEMGAAELVEGLGDSDEALALTLNDLAERKEIGTIMPVPGVPPYAGLNPQVECRFRKPPVVVTPEDALDDLAGGFPAADPPPLIYREAGVQLAAIDFDAGQDFVVRKVRAVQTICDHPFLLLGPEALRLASAGFLTQIQRTWSGLEIGFDDPSTPGAIHFPAERDGAFWLHYGPVGVEAAHGRGRELRRYVSAREVMAPKFDSQRLAGKIALIAVIDLGRVDERRAPIGSIIFGVEAHMQMIEQIWSGHFLRRPWFLPLAEGILLALLGLTVIVLVPMSRASRSIGLVVTGAAGLIGLSMLAFQAGLLIDMATPVLGFVIVAGGVVAATLVERDRQRLLDAVTLEKERAKGAFLQGELDAAARIQRALLPAARFERPGLIDLAAYIDPARTVGGDFYDHVLMEERHLFFLVADVSGKGADASQFMLLSKTLWKSVALRTGTPLERIQLDANAEITRENAATMFVTGLCGLLDLETAVLSYSSAGHELPFLMRPGQKPEQLERFGGPPAGLIDGIAYPVGQVQLLPGDRLFVFTDGVTEAMNPDGDLYGGDRLRADLAALPADAGSVAVIEHIKARLQLFSDGAEQSDDITMMAIMMAEQT